MASETGKRVGDTSAEKVQLKRRVKSDAPNSQHETTAATSTNDSLQIKGLFLKDLEPVMYGYGDDREPLQETVELVEDILVEYLTGVLYKALDASAQRGKIKPGQKVPANALNVDDILHVVRKDPKKYARVQELLIMHEEIKKAKQIVEIE